MSGKQAGSNGPPAIFPRWGVRGSAPQISRILLGLLATALRVWVVGSEVFTPRVLISSYRQIRPDAPFRGRTFSNRSCKPAPHRPRSLLGTPSPTLPSKSSLQRRGWRTCSSHALHLHFPGPLLTVAFPCRVPRRRANENVRGKRTGYRVRVQ